MLDLIHEYSKDVINYFNQHFRIFIIWNLRELLVVAMPSFESLFSEILQDNQGYSPYLTTVSKIWKDNKYPKPKNGVIIDAWLHFYLNSSATRYLIPLTLDIRFPYKAIVKDDTENLTSWNVFDLLAILFCHCSLYYEAFRIPYHIMCLFHTDG